ncbi:S8 family serine peptidase [Paenibacillus thailandensis]|uniref:S8 family serine peptidase n=1 Tax=Paenibacillus thailandensis TaxID=393250 RepID=A0ABW5R2Z9_9BACL
MNEREKAYCRIDQWDAAGKGHRVQKIAIWELQSGKFNPNLFIGYNIIVPPEKIDYSATNEHSMDTTGTYLINRPNDIYHILSGSTADRLQYCIDHNIDIINVSLDSGGWYNDIDTPLKEAFIAQGGIIVCSAGNDGSDGLSGLSRDPLTISVGAVKFVEDRIVRESFSSYDDRGTDLNCMGFDGVVPVHKSTPVSGTSFAAPWVGSILAYFRSDFIDRNGRKPTYQETINLIESNCIDIETVGYDVYSGHGILRLPVPTIEDEPPEIDKLRVTVTANSTIANVNGTPYNLVQAPVIVNGRLMLSFKDIAEITGGTVVSYDNETKTAVFDIGC